MHDDTTTRSADWLLADDVLRDVIGGETGDRMRDHAMNAIADMRREIADDPDGFDAERFAWEHSDYDSGGLFPYTYDMAQAWAESIHHVTFDYEYAETREPFALVCLQVGEIMRQALELAAERIRGEIEGEE